MKIYKVEFDKDYRTVTWHGWIYNIIDVEESWTGYDYSYYKDSYLKEPLSVEEAQECLAKSET
jgi:hypothetical protein